MFSVHTHKLYLVKCIDDVLLIVTEESLFQIPKEEIIKIKDITYEVAQCGYEIAKSWR